MPSSTLNKHISYLKKYLKKDIEVISLDGGTEEKVKGRLERVLDDHAIVVYETSKQGLTIHNLPFFYGASGIMQIRDAKGELIYYNKMINRNLIYKVTAYVKRKSFSKKI